MPTEMAPVVVFAFNRPEHLSQCLNSLRRNPEASDSDLWVFCDGPKDEAQEAITERVRLVARQTRGFRSVLLHESPVNMGLATSVTRGVDQVLGEVEQAIFVEDDLVVSENFLSFMNAGLDIYRNHEEVASIHGFMYDVFDDLPQSVFLRGADCWGWGTWRRAWAHFNPDSDELLERLHSGPDVDDFDFGGAFPYHQMLKDQSAGKIDSWAIRWYASAFLDGMLTLYPGSSLVQNIGMEGSGTHHGSRRAMHTDIGSFTPPLHKIRVVESAQARRAVASALARRKVALPTLGSRLRRLTRRGF